MKKQVLLVALLLSGALGAYAQTKGTNSVGLGIETNKSKYDQQGGNSGSNNASNFSLRYAHFIEDNVKLGVGLFYVTEKNSNDRKIKGYGANFFYQKYFPVYKKLYVFVGGEAGYNYQELEDVNYSSGGVFGKTQTDVNSYSVGVNGGVSYFLGKHWELEARILSAGAGYSSFKNDQLDYTSSSSSFSLKTTGSFTNLGFSINFLF